MKYWMVVKEEKVINTIYADDSFIDNHADDNFEYIEFDPFKAGSPGIGWMRDIETKEFIPAIGEL